MGSELILIGVGHVFDICEKIEEIIRKERPAAIAVELDYNRAMALLREGKRESPNLFYSLMAKLQNLIANKYGVKAGNEMLTAIKVGKEMNIPIIFIDKDANEIINKLWKEMNAIKKIKLLISSFFSIFVGKRKIEEEVKKFEENPENFIKKLEKELPEIKRILIDERNEYMAKNLGIAVEKYGKVVAIVGEGHVEGLKNLLEEMHPEINLKIIHLSQLIG